MQCCNETGRTRLAPSPTTDEYMIRSRTLNFYFLSCIQPISGSSSCSLIFLTSNVIHPFIEWTREPSLYYCLPLVSRLHRHPISGSFSRDWSAQHFTIVRLI